MTKTYQVDNDVVTESETVTTDNKQIYHKDWLVSEIARLQSILSNFK